MEKHYCERDLLEMDRAGNHYGNHVMAMTREGLHSKSDIAAELGWRDLQIAALQQKLDALAAEREKFAVQCAAAKIAIQYAEAAGFECTLNTPNVDSYLNSVRAEEVKNFCQFLAQYGKVEPHHFNADFADLYAKINKEIYESILDNPAVYDMESLVDWLERGVNDSRAYADMSKEYAAQLRAGKDGV